MSNDPQFWQTREGRKLIQATIPECLRQLTRLNDLLALLVEAKLTKPEDKTDDRARQD
ncbi:MAG: hypothetical protein IH621_18415 [Krumholzibacteria bacterium]|nr:hypothetical protein [Candidatus Krumholzibacteria bacterium]